MYEWMCDMEYLKHLCLEDEVELQNGNSVIVLELDDLPEEMINEWANSFRQYYCPDYKLDVLRHGTGLSRKEYLLTRVFPGQEGFGPGTKLGDFTELLISDYITYVRDFLVPKDRYVAKDIDRAALVTDVDDEIVTVDNTEIGNNGTIDTSVEEGLVEALKKHTVVTTTASLDRDNKVEFEDDCEVLGTGIKGITFKKGDRISYSKPNAEGVDSKVVVIIRGLDKDDTFVDGVAQ